MPLTDTQRKKLLLLKDYLQFSSNPTLSAFLNLEKLTDELKEKAEKEISQTIQDSLLKEFELVEKHGKLAAQEEIRAFREETSERIKIILTSFKKDKEDILAELSSEIQREARNIWSGIEREHRAMMANIEQMRGPQGDKPISGIDYEVPKEETIVNEIIKKMPAYEKETSEDIRNKLELLLGDERLEIKAIKNLEEELEKIRQIKGTLGRAVGPSVITPRPLNNITPTGAINGVNADFTLPKDPKKDGERVYLNGVRMRSGASNDYTLTGRTITFNTAPLTNDVIIVDIDY